MGPHASPDPSKLLCDECLSDPQYNQRPSELDPPHPRAVVDERRAGVLVAQDDVDEAVNKAADAQIEAEAVHERNEMSEKTVKEICSRTAGCLNG